MAGLTVEVVEFRVREGVAEDELMAAIDGSQAAIARLPGLVRRELLRGEGGLWVDVLHWASREDALAAAAAFATMPEMAPFGALLDGGSVRMLHLAQARTFA